jgi:hypothetical protein
MLPSHLTRSTHRASNIIPPERAERYGSADAANRQRVPLWLAPPACYGTFARFGKHRPFQREIWRGSCVERTAHRPHWARLRAQNRHPALYPARRQKRVIGPNSSELCCEKSEDCPANLLCQTNMVKQREMCGRHRNTPCEGVQNRSLVTVNLLHPHLLSVRGVRCAGFESGVAHRGGDQHTVVLPGLHQGPHMGRNHNGAPSRKIKTTVVWQCKNSKTAVPDS